MEAPQAARKRVIQILPAATRTRGMKLILGYACSDRKRIHAVESKRTRMLEHPGFNERDAGKKVPIFRITVRDKFMGELQRQAWKGPSTESAHSSTSALGRSGLTPCTALGFAVPRIPQTSGEALAIPRRSHASARRHARSAKSTTGLASRLPAARSKDQDGSHGSAATVLVRPLFGKPELLLGLGAASRCLRRGRSRLGGRGRGLHGDPGRTQWWQRRLSRRGGHARCGWNHRWCGIGRRHRNGRSTRRRRNER